MKKHNKSELLIFSPTIEDGGVEKNLYLITDFLSNKLDRLTVVTANNNNKNKFNKKINIISPKNNRWNKSNRIVKSIICIYMSLRYYLNQNRKITILSFNNNLFAIILSKIINIKVIIRLNTSLDSYLRSFFKKKFFKMIYSLSDKIIVNSNSMKRELKNIGLYSVCIYNPIENTNLILKKSKIRIKEKFFKKNTFNILNIGRLVKQKDQETLLKSLEYINPQINYRLLIIGNGEEKKNLISFINDKKLNKNVKIIEYQNNIYPYIKNSNLFALTSRHEGLPNILIECLALKRIIISTNCKTGPSEILENGKYGKLIKVGDFKMIGKSISEIYQNYNFYNRKAKQGYSSLDKFNYQLNCKKYLNIIKDLL